MPSIRLSARRALVSVKLAVAGLLLGTAAHAAAPAPVPAPEFTGIQTWLNSEPRTLASLRGKVVLVDFWTYTCINCINTLPYVKQWHQKYKDQGLVVVGVHTPNSFRAHNEECGGRHQALRHRIPGGAGQRLQDLGRLPQSVLAGVLPDRQGGNIVYRHFGEGRYAETEAEIQRLLAQPQS
ncbi:redoxin domain-containing protein [Achromobacter xylosoxidans]